MSDGWQVYRYYPKGLRCWAHLIRKAEGLKGSLDITARLFGEQTRLLLNTLTKAVYAARERPPDQALSLLIKTLCQITGVPVKPRVRRRHIPRHAHWPEKCGATGMPFFRSWHIRIYR